MRNIQEMLQSAFIVLRVYIPCIVCVVSVEIQELSTFFICGSTVQVFAEVYVHCGCSTAFVDNPDTQLVIFVSIFLYIHFISLLNVTLYHILHCFILYL